MARCAVYDIMQGGKLLYVGSSVNPKERWMWHRSRRRFPADADMRVVRWYDRESRARAAEDRRIGKLRPLMNRQGGSTYKGPRKVADHVQGTARAIWLSRAYETDAEAAERANAYLVENGRQPVGGPDAWERLTCARW